jgi:hypothetical protein
LPKNPSKARLDKFFEQISKIDAIFNKNESFSDFAGVSTNQIFVSYRTKIEQCGHDNERD